MSGITYQVPALSMVVMGINLLAGLLVPAALYWFFQRRYGAERRAFFTGCGVMLLFAFVLEQLVHAAVLGSAAGDIIAENTWLYALYGGLMAGLFEETGRYVAFRTVLKGRQDNDGNALMYGAGHGGFEMFMILTLTSVSNLALALMMNRGDLAGLAALGGMDTAGLADGAAGNGAAAMAELEGLMAQLAETPAAVFLLSLVERGAAMVAQISLSVLVWFAAKPVKSGGSEDGGCPGDGHVVRQKTCGRTRAFWLYPLAIGLHLLLDGAAAVLSSLGVSTVLIEIAVWIMALGYAALARSVWRRYHAEKLKV